MKKFKFIFNSFAILTFASIFAACEKPQTPPEPENPDTTDTIPQDSIVTPENKSMLKSIIAEDGATFSAISRNGKWAVGSAFDNSDNAGFSIAASVWNLETGERTFLAKAEDGMSEANCVNDEGTIIGGAYLNQPAYYQDGKWNTLQIPEDYTMGTVTDMAIVGGDVIFVGRVQDNDAAQTITAAKWINGVYEKATDKKAHREDHMGEVANVNTCYAISEDGKVIMGALEFNAWPNTTPFVINGEDKFIIETETEQNRNLGFIYEPRMSANGKYITGKYRHVVYNEGEEFATTDIFQPCFYNIETKQFEMFEKVGVEWGGYAVDNNGVVYANTPVMEHPIRQGYVITNGNVVELEQMLLNNGVTQEEIDAASAPASAEFDNKLGTIIAVSRDGKTIIGCAGQCATYNWVVTLD